MAPNRKRRPDVSNSIPDLRESILRHAKASSSNAIPHQKTQTNHRPNGAAALPHHPPHPTPTQRQTLMQTTQLPPSPKSSSASPSPPNTPAPLSAAQTSRPRSLLRSPTPATSKPSSPSRNPNYSPSLACNSSSSHRGTNPT